MESRKANKRGQVEFSSPQELATEIRREIAGGSPFFYDRESWTGEKLADSLERTATGHTARVPEAERLLDAIEAEIEQSAPEWSNDVAGAFPDVPAFLAGAPECMRRRIQTISERAPVRVWVDVSSSAGISHDMLARRGVAALALAMQLIRQGRAVELLTFTSLDGQAGGQSCIVVRMVTAPVDIASVAHCLTSSGFSRSLCYGVARVANGFTGGWSDFYVHSGDWNKRIAGARRTLAGLAAPSDIILPAPYLDDINSEMFTAPAKWVSRMVTSVSE